MMLCYYDFKYEIDDEEIVKAVKHFITDDDITEELDELYTLDDYIDEFTSELAEKMREQITEYYESEARMAHAETERKRRRGEYF